MHDHTDKGTRPDAAHWVGEFGLAPGAELVVKAHVYVLNWEYSKNNGYRERAVLGKVVYQMEWKPGVRHMGRGNPTVKKDVPHSFAKDRTFPAGAN